MGSATHKLALFADDLLLFMQHPRWSLKGIEQLLTLFQQVSGLKLNADKSLLYPLCMRQSEKESLRRVLAYSWVQDQWTYLGVRFPVDFKCFSKVNLESVNTSVALLLKSWSDKNLSWFERIQIVKSLILPKYLFIFGVAPLDVTPHLLNSWQKTLLNVVWSYKRPKPATAISSKKEGGLSIT